MKTTVKFFALLTVVLTLAACDKDKEELRHERDIVYTVAEQTTTTVHLTTEAEWDALLDQFCNYAEGGSSVTFRNAKSANKSATKEAVTYSTTDREAMKRWMAQMEDEGKTVTVTYDPATGTWNGTAYANASPSVPEGCITYATSNANDGHNYGIILTLDTVNHLAYITNGDAYLLHLGGDMPIHFPVGRFAYVLSNNLLQLRTLNNKSSFDYDITVTHQGNGLVLDWQTSGTCPTDHVHQATVYPTNRYQCLFCHNDAGKFLLHLDRTNYNSQKGQAWTKYNYIYNPLDTNLHLPFYSCVFSLDVIMTFAETTYSTWTLTFPLSWLEGNLQIAEIENPGDNPEIWHVGGEAVTTENYNPMRDFDFQRIN
ncbi:MAG: hypothetical protein J6X59_06295 [Bacteroidales bacterium]|nr:hypothetical protein [Bacteroidales bacterium]